MAKIKKAGAKAEKKKTEFMTVWTGIWIVAMTAVFPIFFLNAYADILPAKYGFMLAADGILLAGFLIWAIVAGRPKKYIANMQSYKDEKTGKWFCNWFKNSFNRLDIFVLAFLIITIISLLCAHPYIYQAFYGNEGRWMGAITLILLCLTFFVASRYFKYGDGYIYAFLIGSLIVTLWAFTDYFDIDIIGFKRGMAPATYSIFVSAIGNIDSFAGFASIPMAFTGIMFIFSKKGILSRIFFWLCFAIAALSMITSSADNAYLSFIIFFAFVPLAATRTKAGIRRYIILFATFVSGLKLIGYLNVKLAGIVVMEHNEIVSMASGVSALTWAAIIIWCVAIGLFIYEVVIKKYPDDTPASKEIHTIWLIILIIGIVGSIAMFIYANVTAQAGAVPSALEPFRNYMVFSDEWGTWRGYVWKYLMKIYSELPFMHKVFGTGPETAAIYLFNNAYYDVAETTGFLYDTPHNEWLMMLFNLGPLGLLSYLCVLITPVIMASGRSIKKYFPIVLAVGFVCICHLAESFINITIPLELPIIFALLAIAQNFFRSKE